MTVALLAVIVLLVVVIGWLLRPGPKARRGGTIDLVPAAARGELDLDWSDPRPIVNDDGVEFEVDDKTGGWLYIETASG